MDLQSVGVWSGALRNAERAAVLEAAAELEELGYGTIWFPGGRHEGLAEHIRGMLAATRRVVVATGIVSIWTHPAAAIAAMHHAITQVYPGRFLLGVGISHQHVVQAAGLHYDKPLQKLRSYLDELDAAPTPVPINERILASLGPRSLELARERSVGTHPYFVPVEHTRIARAAVGPGKIVAPEQMVVVETNPERARAIARPSIDRYLHAPNYTNNLLRLGFAEQDFDNGGSDRLVDAIVAWGDAGTISQRLRAHHAAGADHVCIQVLTPTPQDLAASMDGWRQLAMEYQPGGNG
jgi:probable F420-dependent oxidoreductase